MKQIRFKGVGEADKLPSRVGKGYGGQGYSSRINCQIVFDRKSISYIRFKDNVTARSERYPAWRKSFQEFKEDPEKWLAIYHLRSIMSIFLHKEEMGQLSQKQKEVDAEEGTRSQGSCL